AGANRFLAGNFDDDPPAELIVLHDGANRFSVLDANAAGGLLNPSRGRDVVTPRPALAVTGRFNSDPYPDLAVLSEAGDVGVFLGSATGFTEAPARLSAGNRATGLAAQDINRDGRVDL